MYVCSVYVLCICIVYFYFVVVLCICNMYMYCSCLLCIYLNIDFLNIIFEHRQNRAVVGQKFPCEKNLYYISTDQIKRGWWYGVMYYKFAKNNALKSFLRRFCILGYTYIGCYVFGGYTVKIRLFIVSGVFLKIWIFMHSGYIYIGLAW